MDAGTNRRPGGFGGGRAGVARRLRPLLLGLAVLLVGVSAATFVSYRADCAKLREFALEATAGVVDPADKVIALLGAVKALPGTARCERYFGWPTMRATPRQVLAEGGDCADRSRLTAALLEQLGLGASLAMCFDPRTGQPAHTVVEARLTDGGRMLVDPAFGLFFPKQGGGYLGLLQVREGGVLQQRIEELRRERPGVDEYYLRSAASYETVSTYNWDRGLVAKCSKVLLGWWIGEGVYALPRPVMLEEPKVLVSGLAGGLALLLIGAAWVPGRGRAGRPTDGMGPQCTGRLTLAHAPVGEG